MDITIAIAFTCMRIQSFYLIVILQIGKCNKLIENCFLVEVFKARGPYVSFLLRMNEAYAEQISL